MAYFGNRMDRSATSDKLDVKFDARQYEFFSSNLAEHELEGFDESIEYAPLGVARIEDFPSSGKQKGKYVVPFSYVDDLADSFMKLNRISEPKRARGITERVSSSKQGFKKSGSGEQRNNQRHRGRIKWYDNQRGFGFITPDEGGLELYVHCSYLKSDGIVHLLPGARVEYESVASKGGKMQAINVTAPNNILLQDSRKHGLPDLSTLVLTNMGSSPSYCSTSIGNGGGLGPCFSCGKWGHISKDCSVAVKRDGKSGTQKPRDASNQMESGGGWSVMWCYICGNAGHVPTNCPWM